MCRASPVVARFAALLASLVLVSSVPATAQGNTPVEPAVALNFFPLAAAYLPAERIDGAVDAVAYTIHLEAGGRVDFPAGSRPDGATLEYVVGGAYTVRSEGPMTVLRGGARGGGSAEQISPGQEITIIQGEALLNPDSNTHLTVRNPGDQGETLIFGAGVFARGPLPPPAIPAWSTAVSDASVEVVRVQELPRVEGPVDALLARWLLEPGEALLPPGPWPELVWTETSTYDGTSRSNLGATPIEVLVASFGSAD